jgi:transcription initiation factor TFIIB
MDLEENFKKSNFKKSNFKKQNSNNKNFENLWNIFDENFSTKNIIKNHLSVNNECSICNSQLIIGDESYLICSNTKCGNISKNKLDLSPEWRFYGSDDNNNTDPTRCGMPINPLLIESSYSCKILYSMKQTYEMQKIRKYTEWQSMPYREKSQYDEFTHITNISHASGIPKMIIDDAIRYHQKISQAKTFRGLNRDSIIAASIYISCRVNNYPRTSKEIADIFNLDNNSANKGCKNALSIINDIEYNDNEIDNKNNNNNDINLLNKTIPLAFMDRYCSRLNMNNEITNLCKFVAGQIESKNLIPENTPHSIAGGIIYFVSQICKLNISKLEINKISKISEVTINKCYKKLYDIKDQLIPPSILEKYI